MRLAAPWSIWSGCGACSSPHSTSPCPTRRSTCRRTRTWPCDSFLRLGADETPPPPPTLQKFRANRPDADVYLKVHYELLRQAHRLLTRETNPKGKHLFSINDFAYNLDARTLTCPDGHTRKAYKRYTAGGNDRHLYEFRPAFERAHNQTEELRRAFG